MSGRGYFREPNEPTPEQIAEIEQRTREVRAAKIAAGPNYWGKAGKDAPKATKTVVPRKKH